MNAVDILRFVAFDLPFIHSYVDIHLFAHPLHSELKDYISFTPCRNVNGIKMNSYDDRFILATAAANRGIVVSNDKFK